MNFNFRDYYTRHEYPRRDIFGRSNHYRSYVGANQFRIAQQLAGAISGAAAAHFANKDSKNLRGGPPLPPQDDQELKDLQAVTNTGDDREVLPGMPGGTPYVTSSKKKRTLEPDVEEETTKRLRTRRINSKAISEKDMESAGTSEDVEVATDLMAMRSGGGGGGQSAVAHETPVTIPRSITYGFPDTWTCVLPLNLSFQIICEGPKRPAMLSVRMNSIYDCIANGESSAYSGTVSASSTFGSLIGTTASNASANDSYINSNTSKSNLTTGNQQPAWRPFFEAHYDKYHVMGCEWELSTRLSFPESNAHRIRGALATMYHGKEVPPVDGITLADMLYWKNLDQVDYVLPESAVTPMGSVATHIMGRYKPGQHTREVREDAEAKTWTDTGANPTLQENLAIYFCEAPLSWTPLADDIANASLSYQCFLTLKYIVQWKDLKLAWQYPTSATNTEFATHL